MIRTVGELLEELRDREAEALAAWRDVGNPSIIGDMFEGLTQDLLSKALFEGLDLRVVEGVVRTPDGEYSRQIDAMVVQGSGTTVPFTDHSVYDSDQVIAVVEVKTNLHRQEIADAYENLLSVLEVDQKKPFRRRVVSRNYRSIVREELPDEPESEPFWKEMLFHALAVEATQPARIALGHFGYADEYNLRQGFIDFLGENVTTDPNDPKQGFGPTSMPDLILCRDSGLVKLNGLPYSSPLTAQDYWPILASFSGRPFVFLLEVLWTRLNLDFNLPHCVFGEDLEFETASPLLFAKATTWEERAGWMYEWEELERNELADRPMWEEWAPIEVTETQWVVLNVLGVKGEIDPQSDDLRAFLEERGEDPDEFLASLLETGLVFLNKEGRIRYLTDECAVAALPDGRIVAGDAATGRLQRWLARQL